MKLSRDNNFDIIRLAAALQVVFSHSVKHLSLIDESSNTILIFFRDFIGRFPGVPIFFTVSGFLVYWSLERNQNNIKKFFRNRLLRIFPGLWFCFVITVTVLFVLNIINFNNVFNKNLMIWYAGQVSFFQFYTPYILLSFGIVTPNGSLLTITVELQYYILLPLIFLVIKLFKTRKYQNIFIVFLIVFSLSFMYYIKLNYPEESMIHKLALVNVLTYFYNFLFGVLLYKNWDIVHKFIVNKAKIWLVIYITYIIVFFFIFKSYGLGYTPNLFGIFSFLFLSILTISLAYSKPYYSHILKGNDISYGVYIYHMIVINCFVHLNINSSIAFPLTFVITILLSWFSWVYIEKKVLKLK